MGRDRDNEPPSTATEAEADESDEEHEEPYTGPWWSFPPIRNSLISGALIALTFALSRYEVLPEWGEIGLYVIAAALGVSHWGPEAVDSAARLRVNIDVLMGVATVGAAVLGLWEEAAFLAFLYGGAEGLEEFTYDRTRGAIRALLDLAPKEAILLRDGGEVMVPVEDLAVGDRFLVRPGESLPTDGVIRAGNTSLDEAPITGESVPVEKKVGDQLFAGTVNLTGAVEVEATQAFQDNTLSRIIHLVEEAQEQKTGAQRLIDRFGNRYSPAILLGSLVLLVVPPLAGGDFSEWARRAVTLAVAGAPCALVMSTPVAVAAAIGSAGKRGVLIKGGLHLENLGKVTVVAFDKTGTLTKGEPSVTDVMPLWGGSPEDALRLAATVEAYSQHPLARAIVRRARRDRLDLMATEGFEALTGAGARARVDSADVYVGSLSLFESLGTDLDGARGRAEAFFEEGKTVVLVGTAERAEAILCLRDEIREEASEAIRALHAEGIPNVAMLTGDNRRTARAIADELGIDEVKAELKPEDKSTAIRELEQALGPSAMVGDGINDAPALAVATVGVAMGTAGTDAAIEAADVALMGDDLRGVAQAVRLGRRARRIGGQNITFSILLLAILVPSAVVGVLAVAVAVTAHEVAEIIAVLNGLRARARGR
jgi:heavy metal translocating P-type ATPase